MTKFIVAGALALGLALPARADTQTTVVTTPAPAQTVEVQTDHKNPVGTILVAGLGGALIGGAVGGGVAVYERYGKNNGDWGNWQRDLFVGAGIGLGVGLIIGVVDYATSGPSTTSTTATTTTRASAATTTTSTEAHDVGFSPAIASHGFRF